MLVCGTLCDDRIGGGNTTRSMTSLSSDKLSLSSLSSGEDSEMIVTGISIMVLDVLYAVWSPDLATAVRHGTWPRFTRISSRFLRLGPAKIANR